MREPHEPALHNQDYDDDDDDDEKGNPIYNESL